MDGGSQRPVNTSPRSEQALASVLRQRPTIRLAVGPRYRREHTALPGSEEILMEPKAARSQPRSTITRPIRAEMPENSSSITPSMASAVGMSSCAQTPSSVELNARTSGHWARRSSSGMLVLWRQAAGAGGREGRGRGASDGGAPGLAPGRCEAGPGARAPAGRVVLRLEPPQPRAPGSCRAPAGSAARAGVYPKGLRGLSGSRLRRGGRLLGRCLLGGSLGDWR
jgi:hypothetical protein